MAWASYRARFVRRLVVVGVLVGLTYILNLWSLRMAAIVAGILLLEAV
jgi:hypothetical protein